MANLQDLTKKIKKEGKEKGLTDRQLGNRKNKHWNHIYTSIAWSFRIFLISIGIWIMAILVCYLKLVINDPDHLKKIVDNSVWSVIILLATLGGEKIFNKFFP